MDRPPCCGYCKHWSYVVFCPNHRYAPDLDTPGCEHYVVADESRLRDVYRPDGVFDLARYRKKD